jgi:hypothetical protein
MKKVRPQYVVPAIFFIVIGEENIRTANPALSGNEIRLDLAVMFNFYNFCMALANLKPALRITEKAKTHRLEIKIVETRIASN